MIKTMYSGEATVTFEPDARLRYKINDPVVRLIDKNIRGVTTTIGEILDKPGLRLWARDEMATRLMGAGMVEGKLVYGSTKALIQPDVKYTAQELQTALEASYDAYKDKSDRGKDIGTMTHDFIARYLKDGITSLVGLVEEYPDAPDEFKQCATKAVNCFAKWWESIEDKEVLGVENLIYSREYQFAGTYDLKCRINGKIYMLDIKTTNRSPYAPLGIYPEYFMQLGGYMVADSEESGQVFDDCGIINVGKDGRLSIATASDIGMTVDECKQSFIFAVTIHDWLNKLGKLTSDSHFVSKLEAPMVDGGVDDNKERNK